MNRLLLIGATAVLALVAASFASGGSADQQDYQAMAERQAWEWDDGQAKILYSLNHYKGFHDVSVVKSP